MNKEYKKELYNFKRKFGLINQNYILKLLMKKLIFMKTLLTKTTNISINIIIKHLSK